MNATKIKRLGYYPSRLIESGEYAGIQDMVFTVGLFVGLTDVGYRTRFCYPNRATAEKALKEWDGYKDPPGPWIKEKGRVDRRNPNGFIKSVAETEVKA